MDAKMMYQKLHKKSKAFAFEHCWEDLRYQPKWLNEYEKKNQTKSSKRKKSSTPDTPIDLEGDDVPTSSFVDLERPLGRKSEKQIKRDHNADVPIIEVLEGIREDNKVANAKKEQIRNELMERRFADNTRKLELIAERVKIDKEKQLLQQKREDERIMLIDTSRLEPCLKEYYVRRQEEILKS